MDHRLRRAGRLAGVAALALVLALAVLGTDGTSAGALASGRATAQRPGHDSVTNAVLEAGHVVVDRGVRVAGSIRTTALAFVLAALALAAATRTTVRLGRRHPRPARAPPIPA